jgi:hypothetical protein
VESRLRNISAQAISSPSPRRTFMAGTESLGAAGVEWLERLAGEPADRRRLRVPTITDPRGTDFAAAQRLQQQPCVLELRRAIAAFYGPRSSRTRARSKTPRSGHMTPHPPA